VERPAGVVHTLHRQHHIYYCIGNDWEIFTCSLVAYGFARFRFPGRNVLFILMLATMMLPGIITLLPTFIIWRQLKLIDTYDPMVIGAWFAWGPAYIFLLRQFFMSIPKDIEDAARIDGANPFQIYWKIIRWQNPPAGACSAYRY
jgi:multiple sugar transport system permease protein